jgi:hypothetical protein
MNPLRITPWVLATLCGVAGPAAQAAPVVYPSKGQNAVQTDRDKLACFDWSKAQSGFDPMQAQAASPPPGQTQGSAAGMFKGAAGGAAVAELSGRDVGKGAAAGVLGAAVRGRIQQQQAAGQQKQQQQAQRATFDRAFGACMEGRGYVVK